MGSSSEGGTKNIPRKKISCILYVQSLMALSCVKTLYQGFVFQLRCLFNFQYLINLNHKLPNSKTVHLGRSSGRNGTALPDCLY